MKTYRILIAEDNPADVLLLREALREHEVKCELQVAPDGDQAARLLECVAAADSDGPDLIVLDLNLPKVDGLTLLKMLRENSESVQTPVVILTSSESPNDRKRAIQMGVSRYIHKPSGFDEFMAIGGVLKEILVS